MSERNDKEYAVGFKRPPRQTQFKPGQSGNPNGRPKKTDTMADVLEKELNRRITIVKDGKRKRVPMLQAIVTQIAHSAAKGDTRAFDSMLKALKAHPPTSGDNLGALVQEFRAIHERHKASDQERRQVSESGDANRKTRNQAIVSPGKEGE